MLIEKSNLRLLLIIFLAIGGLAFLAYSQFKGFQETISGIELLEFKVPEVSLELPQEEGQGQKEFVTPDGELKLKYSANWLEMEKASLEKTMKSEKGEILLFAYKSSFKELALYFLVVQQLSLEAGPEAILEETKKDIESKGGEMEIINLKLEENEAEFEAKYQIENKGLFYAKEKIVLAGENYYLITVFSSEKDWPEISTEADTILNSVHLVE